MGWSIKSDVEKFCSRLVYKPTNINKYTEQLRYIRLYVCIYMSAR